MEGNHEKTFMQIKDEVIQLLQTVFDPEIPVNIYELGLVYSVDVSPDHTVKIEMTLTSPNCPVAESLPREVQEKVMGISGVKDVDLQLTFDPPWDQTMMSEAARLELGFI